MDQAEHKKMVQQAVKKRFHGHKTLKCKYHIKPPEQTTREYIRLVNRYMRELNELLKLYLPEITEAAKNEDLTQYREDGLSDFLSKVGHVFDKIGQKLKELTGVFDLKKRVQRLGDMETKRSGKEWSKAVHETLGIDLQEDYYNGDLYTQLLSDWVDANVDLIVTIPHEALGKMREMMLAGYKEGKPTTELIKEIQNQYTMSKAHARLIARDQMAKLNGEITQKQQQDAGVSEYIWDTSGDSRVRASHQALDQTKQKWSEPPIVDAKRGRRCHPGMDYQCRCVALPVFDYDDIDLPIEMGGA